MGNENMNFKDIPGYEGLYQVSECGKVKSLERISKMCKGGVRFNKEKILKSYLDKDGYEITPLSKFGSTKHYKVHRLVMFAHSHVDNELTVNHIDENKRNNHISNLEYCTRGENVKRHRKNNPEFASELGKKSGEYRAKKFRIWKYIETGELYTMKEASTMMHDTGLAPSVSTWFHILQKGLPQDRFVKI